MDNSRRAGRLAASRRGAPSGRGRSVVAAPALRETSPRPSRPCLAEGLMRTIDRLSSNPAFSWLRGDAGRVRRAMMAQPPAVRLGLVLAPVLLLAGAAYWAAGTLTPSAPRYLAQGQAFSSDDLITVFRALNAKGIWYRPDDRRIEVAADQYAQAMALLGKLDIGPRSVDEIRRPSS